jgi:hypothetical protein
MADLLFPKAEYTEDQKNAHEILYFHGIEKGIQAGSIVGFGLGGLTGLIRKQPIMATAIRGSGIGLVFGSLLVPAMIFGKMKDKEQIEFQDRAWRLLQSNSQNVIKIHVASRQVYYCRWYDWLGRRTFFWNSSLRRGWCWYNRSHWHSFTIFKNMIY